MDSPWEDVLSSGRMGLLKNTHLPETEDQPVETKPSPDVQVHPIDSDVQVHPIDPEVQVHPIDPDVQVHPIDPEVQVHPIDPEVQVHPIDPEVQVHPIDPEVQVHPIDPEVQVHPIDLSLKSSHGLFPRSQPLNVNQRCYFHNETNTPHCGGERVESSWLVQGGDHTECATLGLAVEGNSAGEPALMGADSTSSSAKDLLETHSPVVVKEEIEEVCIGEMDSYWQALCSPALPNEMDSDMGSEDTADSSKLMLMDNVRTIKSEREDILVDDLGGSTKDAAEKRPDVAEGEVLNLDGNADCVSNGAMAISKETVSRNGSSHTMQSRDDEGFEEKRKEGAGLQLVPSGNNQEVCAVERECDEQEVQNGRGVKRKMVGEEEALNLSLTKTARQIHTITMERYLEEGNGVESTLVMEVDEIVQREVEDEEDEHDDDNDHNISLEKECPVVNVLGWDSSLSPPPVSLHHSPSFSTSEDSSLDGLLLIDDQGIPYILTPDGEKVFQVIPSKTCKLSIVNRLRPREKHVELTVATSSPDDDLPKQSLTQISPCVSSKDISPHLDCDVSRESSTASKIVSQLNTKSNSETAIVTTSSKPSSISNVTSQPVQILTNPASNILLVPSSHLSASPSSKPKSNSALLTLSLPISLNANQPAAPLFFVLSPVTTTSANLPSSSAALSVADPTPTSLIPSKLQAASSAPLLHSPSPAVTGSSSPSSPSPPVNVLSSKTSTTSVVMNGGGTTFNSPSISSGSTVNTKPDLVSKTKACPSTSSLDKASKPNSPSNVELTSAVENVTEHTTSPIPTASSPVKSSHSVSPPCTPPSVMHDSRDSYPVSQPESISEPQVDPFSSDKAHYTSSDTPPMTIFPTNHPKNFSLSSSCPRRILYCQFCPRAFYYLSDLERHSITHSQSKPHVCPICNKAFKRSSHLERHKHIHTGQRNFICPICSKRFREAGELLRHQRVHTGEKPFQCSLCHMRFAERNTLRRHTKRKHQELNSQGDGDVMQGAQESAEWYSCTVPEMDSDTEPEKE